MRKTLEAVSLVALLTLWGLTAFALFGPRALPDRIPTHFNAAGVPDGWGTPSMLWVMPGIGLVLYGLMTLVARFPGSFNYPARVTPTTRPALEALALRMIVALKAEVIIIFAWIQYQTLELLRGSQSSLMPVLLPLAIVLVFGTIGWHIFAMRRTARRLLFRRQ